MVYCESKLTRIRGPVGRDGYRVSQFELKHTRKLDYLLHSIHGIRIPIRLVNFFHHMTRQFRIRIHLSFSILELIREPIQSFVEAIASGGASGLYVPVAIA